jgi:uncharacterized protein (TIGR03435 family)
LSSKVVVFLLPSLLLAQEFEVASIRPSAQGQAPGILVDSRQVVYSALSLKLCLGIAYKLQNYEISAPDWMASERWDITAKLPDGSDTKQIPEMLKTLLSNRFRIKLHRETRELPVYALVKGKGELALKEAPPDRTVEDGNSSKQSVGVGSSGSGTGTTVNYGDGSHLTIGGNKFEGSKLPMAAMAGVLARFADRPVVDMTNLKGKYDFVMEFSPEDFGAMMIRAAVAQGSNVPPDSAKIIDAPSGDSLFNAVAKLGLALELRKVPMEVLVVDEASKTPTEN